ncbi:NUMOD4 domain-containing protein [Staphylococcus aureus]|uniref:NUMOD4 domain-containing protein n=1 Tax=Staphylococcus aureus TaxID=1280 RepID=UPI0020C152A4|nr:NUMOD4 domain-containing protein [Staphylococcus aureus]
MTRWRSIENFEGIYEVSENGEVRTCEGKTTHSVRHGIRVWNPRILKQKTDKGGYKRVSLYKDKQVKTCLVHRLVAAAFCERDQGKEIINHIDGNPGNNHYSNLEWCDHRENLIHAFKNKLNKKPKFVLLTDKRTKKEYRFYSMAEASRFLGKSPGWISYKMKTNKTESDRFRIEIVNELESKRA